MSAKVKSQNLSIMLTDLQGYTNTTTKCSREEIISLIRRYNQLLAPMIEFYGGKIIKTIGDAFLATFHSATDAVICAIIIQLVLKEYNDQQQSQYLKMNTRVVVHSGDVSIENNDIYGDAVNVTARIEGLECFPGGTIGISETTYLLMDKNEVSAEKVGPQVLKGIPEPVTVYRVPLEKQKLKSTPPHLSKLVLKVLGSGDSQVTPTQLQEWTSSIHSYLKEKNWGENANAIGENLTNAKNQIGRNLGQVQQHIVKSLSQKTILEQGAGSNSKEAAPANRFKAFAVDAVILIVVMVILQVGWWFSSRMVFGRESFTEKEFFQLKNSVGTTMWSREKIAGDWFYYRPKGFFESILGLNCRFPAVLIFLYFAVCWKVRGASLGQVVAQTAVVSEGGEPITWGMACKRSLLFCLSVPLLFGVVMLFIGEKKTWYDKICQTRVIE